MMPPEQKVRGSNPLGRTSFADWLPFTFDPLALQLQSNSPNIGQFFTEIADYATPLSGMVINGACPTTCPQYSAPTLSLSPVLSNSMGFSFNAASVLKQIAKAINDYRANKNATATQADVIAHSMGGLVTLTAVERSNFVSRLAYGKGRIERLITIGTPYLGSPVATQALQGNPCVTKKVLALAGKYAILSANTNPPQGGIGDLQGCPNGSLMGCMNALGGQLTDPTGGPVPSQAIQAPHPQSDNGVQVPAAYVGAYETAVNTSALDVSSVPAGIRYTCPNDPLAQNLTGALWKQNIFGGLDSDGVVSVISQMNGASTSPPNFLTPNDIHSAGLEALGFAGLTELQDSKIASQVFQLLNMPTSQFSLIPSSGGGN